ncbi:MAG TPA: hypothetical protein VF702_07595 [Allosphingosinicella sp.]|jgi:hypothetical protein
MFAAIGIGFGIGLAAVMASAQPAAQPPPLDEGAAQERCLAEGQNMDIAIASIPPAQRRRILSCLTGEAARQLNARTPFQVQDGVTMTRVSAEGQTMTYEHRIDVDAAAVGANGRAAIEAAVRANVCGARDMVQAIGNGAAFAYVFADRAGQPIHRFLIDRC